MRFMKNPLFAQVYEHLWRPTFTRLFSFGGTATEDYDRALRADAHAMPFADNTFDTVTCLAALYLIPDPIPVLDELVRVARTGGEVIVFTSVVTGVSSLPGVREVAGASGYRIFGRHEIVDRLRAAGLEHVEQTITGQGQYVIGIKS